MGLWLVNSTPADAVLRPSGLVQFSAKSDAGRININTLDAKLGVSRLAHAKQLPELDENLSKYGSVTLRTPEGMMPLAGECSRTIGSGRLIISKDQDDVGVTGVYEYTVPVDRISPSSLAYLKLRRWPWAQNTPEYNPVAGAAAPMFGLRSSFYRTSCLVQLRDDGNGGSLVLSGVYAGRNVARQVAEAAFPWVAVPNEQAIELWIFLNSTGLPLRFGVPQYTPIVEVWGKLPSWTGPKVLTRMVVTALGTDRADDDQTATIVFGNGGLDGDVVDIEDWAIYPDFRQAAVGFDALYQHSLILTPDAPVSFNASDGVMPGETAPAHWERLSGKGSIPPSPEFGFQPGRKVTPSMVVLDKFEELGGERAMVSSRIGFERREPRIGTRQDGFMLETFLSGSCRRLETDCTGAGVGVQDGQYAYRVLMYQTAVRRSLALQKTSGGDILTEQHLPQSDEDWSTAKLVRLAVDRARQKVTVWSDEKKIIEQDLGSYFPRSRDSLVEVGHLLELPADAQMNLGFINYLNSFRAYEASDGFLPTAAASQFQDNRTDGFAEMKGDFLKITKTSIHKKRSHHLFYRAEAIDEFGGGMFDFRARCPIFWDMRGTPMGGESSTGVGLEVYLGPKKLQLGFYNCGVHGKKIGILPASGKESDIINQTELGKQFSADCDWTVMQNYRLIVRAFDSIQVWVGSNANKPAIVIPWRRNGIGFDIPQDYTPSGFAFGHFGDDQSSESEWGFLRWGVSSGYEAAVSQSYPNGVRHDQYGGRSLLFVDFSE